MTLFWPINFLRLQLQNNSALGVEVNPEAYSCTLIFQILKYLIINISSPKLNKYITTVQSNLRTKLKLYMHKGLSIYQTKYCKTTFLVSPCLCYILFNRPVVGKTALLRQKSQQTHYYYRTATKIAKAYKYLLL